MSGPKVVRIVTPQERQIIKDRWLARLKQALAKLENYARNNDCLDEDLQKGLEETLDYFENISANDYRKIEREAPEQIQYLKAEHRKLKNKVEKTRASDWEVFKNLKSTHIELTTFLTKKGIHFESFTAPTILSKNSLKEYKMQVDKLFDLLKENTTQNKLSTEQQEILQRLSQGDSLLSVSEWRATFPESLSRLKKLELTLKEMFIHGISQEKIQSLIDRCMQLDSKEDTYTLQLDSLILDAANFQKNTLGLKEAREELSDAIELLETLKTNFNFMAQWKEIATSENITEIRETTVKAKQLYEEITENLVATARREAIKRALKKAGYEVNEGMDTAWVENGRLVVKKTTNSLYGVEFMAPKNLNRIQARVVADQNRSNERSPAQDKNQEELWCDDFDHIRSLLAEEDLEIVVDKMQEPGAVKLKEVDLKSGYDSRAVKTEKKKSL